MDRDPQANFNECPGKWGNQFDLTKSDCLTICLIQFVLFTSFGKPNKAKRFLASTLCTLLSSQGSDASGNRNFGFDLRSGFSILPTPIQLKILISSYFWRWRFVHLSRNSRQNFKLWTTSQDYAVVGLYVKSNQGI